MRRAPGLGTKEAFEVNYLLGTLHLQTTQDFVKAKACFEAALKKGAEIVQAESDGANQTVFVEKPHFSMDDYRNHINSILTWDGIPFSEIVPLIDDIRIDRIWRFITLIYMQHDREVKLTQHENDILVKRVYREAYA